MADSLTTALGWAARRTRVARFLAGSRARVTPSTEPLSLAQWIERYQPAHYPIPWHLAQLVSLLERAAREPTLALVSMPPRHGKSASLTAALAWVTSQQPWRRSAYITYQQDLAQSVSRRVRRLVQESGVSLASDASRVSEWLTTDEGGLSATGIGSGLTGRGFDGLVIVDDPLRGREEAESLSQREKAWEGFNSDAFTRLNPGGSLVVVATRWHRDDLIGRLEQSVDPRWDVLSLPAIRDDEGNPSDEGHALWPERFDLASLRRIRAQIGEYAWASLYQQHPVPRDGILFRAPARYTTPALDGARLVLACDPAGSAKTRADYTAAIALAVRGLGAELTADVLDVLRFQEGTDAAARKLRTFQTTHGGARMHLESSRDGVAIADTLRAIVPGILLAEAPARGDKFTRAQAVIAAWNQGRVRVPVSAPWLDAFLAETERFTGVNDPHDDQVDALAHAFNAAGRERRGGGNVGDGWMD